MTAKTQKLWVHKRDYKYHGDDIWINPKDFTDVCVGDVLEIYHPEDEFSRLLLQVTTLTDEFQQKGTVSIEQSIASNFQLRAYKDVIVRKVDPKSVALDRVELLFKDQYYSRSDFWRLQKGIINTVAYLNKKMEHSEMRPVVNELWSKGERVTCGMITSDTRIVYRSSTAVVQIFIQMSSEMWDFDINGDLYFEKAVDGFLTDLFARWKEQNCLHDVTIVLFSRSFYKGQSKEDFPLYMRDCIECDYKGRFYEDFYRIVVQNERYDDWTSTIKQLRKLFHEYPDSVLNYHRRKGFNVPKAYNSTAAQGNFLETLNMSLNLFEKYYMDRNFDRTGKVAVVITPGPGVFEVDRELSNITKQRTIDCGVGSDLVCMGEQPLHAAPLFKFHSKSDRKSVSLEVGNDYNIPHWMNHSFYMSRNQILARLQGSFVPRIKPPPEIPENKSKRKERELLATSPPGDSDDDNFPFVDYDEYDAQVFKLPTPNFQTFGFGGYTMGHPYKKRHFKTFAEAKRSHRPRTRHTSEETISTTEKVDRSKATHSSSAILIPTMSRSSSTEDLASSTGCYPMLEKAASRDFESLRTRDELYFSRRIVGSASPVGHSRKMTHEVKSRRALINPFAPSKMQFKMTSYRRRWVHAFPTDPQGVAVQTHHFHTYSHHSEPSSGEQTLSREAVQVLHQSMHGSRGGMGVEGPGPPGIGKVYTNIASRQAVQARKQRSLTRQDSDEKSDCNGYDNQVAESVGSSAKSVSPVHSQSNLDRFIQGSSFGSTGQNYSSDMYMYTGSRFYPQQYVKDSSKSYMWGPTGEQEWSPDMTTGQDWSPLESCESISAESALIKPILTADKSSQNFCAAISVDWKSLTIPASLPITTDFLPDKWTLDNDYTVCPYTLLPDDVNSDYLSNPPINEDERYFRKKPLTVQQVFQEIISQRLSQGFQIIITKKPSSSRPDLSLSSSPQYQHTSKLIRGRPRQEYQEEYFLSIGLIFHKLTMSGQNIQVTRYRPRHESPQMTQLYRYRFQVPDSHSYDVSTSEFKNEKLENYNWNYLDQYICTRGEADYGLIPSLKFWRSRFFLLPSNNLATKKIIEGSDKCDIYVERNPTELQKLVTGFIRYLETLNKIKRTSQTRRPKHSGDQVQSSPSSTEQSTPKQSSTTQTSQKEQEVLHSNLPHAKLIEAMKDTQTGLPLLPKQTGLPEQSFISEEAVDWCMQNLQDIKTVDGAVALMQSLLDEQLICHGSENPRHNFIYGFYLYYIVPPKDKSKPDLGLGMFNSLFQNEWCEICLVQVNRGEKEDLPVFQLPDSRWPSDTSIDPKTDDWRSKSGIAIGGQGWGQHSGARVNLTSQKATLLHKYVHVDVDCNCKSDRPEWGTARYHAYYSPKCAFELEIQWMVASGCIFGDLIYTWARKASVCGFHLLPVPVDPFALPSAPDSDPLRGPIYVPLDITSLEREGSQIFDEFDQDAKVQKILEFQEAIIKRFGFMPTNVCVTETGRFPLHAYSAEEQQQYVHCTGGMFILIECNHTSSPTVKTSPFTSSFGKKSSSELRKDYIARQSSKISREEVETESKIGFLWSWNFMLSKRWRTPSTGDEVFLDKVMADFRAFCSNRNDRLLEFWEEYRMFGAE